MTAGKHDFTTGMKSAYDLALERLESQGIEPPSEQRLDDATREAIAAARRKTEAKLAELEILHQKERLEATDPVALEKAEGEYHAERRRLGEKLEHKIKRLRDGD